MLSPLIIEDRHWHAFVDLMGNPEWASGEEWGTLAYRAGHLMEIGRQNRRMGGPAEQGGSPPQGGSQGLRHRLDLQR